MKISIKKRTPLLMKFYKDKDKISIGNCQIRDKRSTLRTFCDKYLGNNDIICIPAQNFMHNIICKMKYNIASITDYLEELTDCKTRCLTHVKGEDSLYAISDERYSGHCSRRLRLWL